MVSRQSHLVEALLAVGLDIRFNVPISELSSFSLNGEIPILADASKVSQVIAFSKILSEYNLPLKILGSGSNLIIRENSKIPLILRLGMAFAKVVSASHDLVTNTPLDELILLNKVENLSENILAFAACSLMGLSRRTGNDGLSGLEFAAGIPASLGGATVMNAGAHGHSMSEVIEGVFFVQKNGELKFFDKSQLKFSYRRTNLPADSIVLATLLRLSGGDPEKIKAKRNECLAYRKRTQPLHLPSAGSVFRNPSPDDFRQANMAQDGKSAADFSAADFSAAVFLEQAKLKGERRGNVAFSELHANWLVKVGEPARGEDAVWLIEMAMERVYQLFGLKLHPEIVIW